MKLAIALMLLIPCSCLITMKTARITPVSENSHTFAAELISEDYNFGEDFTPNIRYIFRRGITAKTEIGFNAEAINPSLSLGFKYGITPKIALDINGGIGIGIFKNVIPIFDVALIFGNEKLFGGIKYELMANSGYNESGEIHPFLGYEFKLKNNFKIIPELGFALIDVPYHYYSNHIFPGNNFGFFIGLGLSK